MQNQEEKIKIELLELTEHEDGGATLSLDLNERAVKMLCEYALLDILTKAAERDIKNLRDEDGG
jgi:hypothetical protein